jgi:hypothetical protein
MSEFVAAKIMMPFRLAVNDARAIAFEADLAVDGAGKERGSDEGEHGALRCGQHGLCLLAPQSNQPLQEGVSSEKEGRIGGGDSLLQLSAKDRQQTSAREPHKYEAQFGRLVAVCCRI